MNPFRSFLSALRRKADLNEELESHLRMAVADRIAQGQSPAEARREVLREFGNMALVADVTRELWGWLWLEQFLQDLKYAARQLRQSPAFTLTALLTLMLAIGANTTIFSLAYALLLKTLPVAHPNQLVQVEAKTRAQMGKGEWYISAVNSGGFFDVLAEHQKVFSGLCAWESNSLDLSEHGETKPLDAALITGDCFRTLGLKPALGRLFTTDEDREGGGPEGYPIVLSYDFWRDRFDRDPKVLGKRLLFQKKPAIIVGVAPRNFRGITVGGAPLLYAPSEIGDHEERHRFGSLNRLIVGRLKDGVSPVQAAAQLDSSYNAWIDATHPEWRTNGRELTDADAEQHVLLKPARTGYSYIGEEYRKPLLILQLLVSLCLLVACAYLATMFSARALNRRHELALRSALGASRGRIARQLLCECLLLGLGGAVLSTFFAWSVGRFTLALLSSFGKRVDLDLSPHPEIVAFTLGLSVLTVLLFGVGPALRASRVNPATDIQQGRQTLLNRMRKGRLSGWLMPIQIALSVVIVTAGVLLSSSLVKLLSQDLGFHTKNVIFVRTDFSSHPKKDEQSLYGPILERLNHAPGIESASLSQTHQLSGAIYMFEAKRTLPSGQVRADKSILTFTVAPRYLETIGARLLTGREFTNADGKSAPRVCILNETAARYFFPDGSAIGGTLQMDGPVQVIGIARDTKDISLWESTARMIYLPIFQRDMNPYPEFVIRNSSPGIALASLRSVFRQTAPDVPLYEPLTIQDALNSAASEERLLAILGDFLAMLALLLTAIGVYGLMNSEVSWRRTEIGIRMALGASRGQVLWMVLRQMARVVLPGIVAGVIGAAVLSKLSKSLLPLYRTSPIDPASFALSLAALLFVAAIAVLQPARKAAAIEPMEAIRTQ